uniref:Anaphase-promoting complex subunit 4 WD40 domain-containing protein n=1 Tax=Aureoumbra lagunensis TaxID=44058 RepID=A0A7S3NGU0_9STRA
MEEGAIVVSEPSKKRARIIDDLQSSSIIVTDASNEPNLNNDDEDERYSGLKAPIMLLTGHQGAIYRIRFSPCGEFCASGGADRSIFLWEVYGDCCNYNVLTGHKNAICDLTWCNDRTIATASADKTVCLWDTHAGKRKRNFKGHRGFTNAVCAAKSGNSLASGADDATAVLWDQRSRGGAVVTMHCGRAVTAVEFDQEVDRLFTGGIDDTLKVWDLRQTNAPILQLYGHENTITDLALSPDGKTLLSNGMDSKLFAWDIRPFVAPASSSSSESENRRLAHFLGAKHDFHRNLLGCSWSSDGSKISAGSSDCIVHIWDFATADELYYLPGHQGSVNDVQFHPKEPIVASASSDLSIYFGEIAP